MGKIAFSERLRDLMQERDLMQRTVALDLHYNPTTISSWVRGRNEPSMEVLVALEDYFGVTIDYLVGRTDER